DYLATASVDGEIRVIDLAAFQDRAFFRADPSSDTQALCLAFSPDGKQLFGGCADHTVRVWDFLEKKLVATYKEHTDYVNCLVFAATEPNTLITGGEDGVLRLWKPAP